MGQRKGYKQTPEHIRNRLKHGKDHPRWKGDDITERSGRCRALRMYPDVGPCQDCGSTVKVERHHIDDNTKNNERENIAFLCRKCHRGRDGLHIAFGERAKARIKETTACAAAAKKARTCCRSGHPYSGENLYIHPRGVRVCRECTRVSKAKYNARKKANASN